MIKQQNIIVCDVDPDLFEVLETDALPDGWVEVNGKHFAPRSVELIKRESARRDTETPSKTSRRTDDQRPS